MHKIFGYKALAVAVASVSAMSANAAGLDRSGQDVTAFLQDGTYAEAAYTYIDANVSGYDNAVAGGAGSTYVKGNDTGDIAEGYDFFRYGVKADINDRFSVGVIYDEPFGGAVQHPINGSSNFVAQGGDATIAALTANSSRIPNLATAQAGLTRLTTAFTGIAQLSQAIAQATAAGQTAQVIALQTQLQTVTNQVYAATGTTNLSDAQAVARKLGAAINTAVVSEAQKGEGTNVEIRSQNVTGLLGVKLGQNRNIQVYGGAAAQRLTGEVHLRGTAYQGAAGYDANISPDQSYGWVAGVSYSKPEIALKAALTYRSEIEHDTTIAEVFPALGSTAGIKTQNFKVTLPESYNLDFQTGVSPTMLLTAKARYVPWANFNISPTLYTATTSTPILSYGKDQWSAELGLAKKLSDKFVVSGTVGYDSGAGNPATTLGPIEGYYSAGLGARYNITPKVSVSAGAKYLKFGDATAQLPNKAIAGQFNDNDGYIVGVKLAYQAK